MRFLQTEWHRHERDRNAWEIERAEMKANIAKLEGENRTNKKLQDSLGKHVSMLEQVLKKEREKFKTASSSAAGQSGETKKNGGEPAEEAGKPDPKPLKPPLSKHQNSFLDVVSDASTPYRLETNRQKSRIYLERCVQEITYLLTPPAHPPPQPPPQQDAAHAFAGQQSMQQQHQHQQQQQQQLQQQPMEHVYMHDQRQRNQQHSMGLSQSSHLANHAPPPVPLVSDITNLSHPSNHIQQASNMSRSLAEQQPLPQNSPLSILDAMGQPRGAPPIIHMNPEEESVEKITHNYDLFGRAIPPRHEELGDIINDSEGWIFEDTLPTAPPSEVMAEPQRSETDLFPNAHNFPSKSPPRPPGSHRRKGSMSRRRSDASNESRELTAQGGAHMKADSVSFKVRFALRGHLDVVRAVIFTGGGSPSEPEICTTGDDGVIKRWIIPGGYTLGPHGPGAGNDLDIQSYFSHRGHSGVVTSLAACPSSQKFSSGGRALGDGWIFSGGQDTTVRVWERGRVDPKATLVGHTDAVWTVCVLPASCASIFGSDSPNYGGPDRILLASGAADGTVRIWAVSAPPQLSSSHSGSKRGVGGSRRHSVSSGSGFPSSPQPSTATSTPFNYTLVHTISRPSTTASPTCISPLSLIGDTFVVSYADARVLIFDTRTGEEISNMLSLETYDGTPSTSVNAVMATTVGLDTALSADPGRGLSEDEGVVHGATGLTGGVEGVVITGHEDQYIRLFDANSGQCTYGMLAHPSAISALSLSPDGRELVSAGHDCSLRFWSLEKRSCTQELTNHRLMRGEGVCAVVWSQDGRWVVSGGGDGVVKVFSR
ncbi:MAG: hypothetical protein M1829_000053 [Trizodia sp. TS-e1964]|nr:MAG: hypothetical protein M1829_000053 [Trizodia sp. TS-e1964]